ncbi:MAG: Dna2/Cas4 domain-containing protein, partial [Alistipes sp.]|nr:Dna2/Cas4 domain-containing protein [Alistipes sp.]
DQEPDADERAFFRSLRLQPPEEAFERIVIRHELRQDKRLTAYLQAIHEQIIAFCANKIADIPLFLRWWDEQGSSRSLAIERSASTVEIMTVHKAKGLEKRAVIIPYCSWQLDPKSGGNIQNIVWAEASSGEAADIGRFPVKYKRAMAESEFSAEYYREQVYAHVDNVNLLYVALTRAAESLHIFVPERGTHVGSLLLRTLAAAPEGEGRRTDTEAGVRYEFGEFTGPNPEKKRPAQEAEHVVLENYLTAHADLGLRLPSQRYFEEGDTELSPRNFGILMHRAFQEADDESEIRQAVQRMRDAGILSDEDAATLRSMIDKALDHPAVREWFGDGWERIRNENAIIAPGKSSTRRPDRVMVAGDRALVVDYKFGRPENSEHRRQLRDYMQLLREMGYRRIEGYLWYVKRGEIIPVEF